MTLEYVNYIMSALEHWEYFFTIHIFMLNLESWMGVTVLALCVGITIHP